MGLDFSDWNLLTPEQEQVIEELNRTQQPFPAQATLIDLFQQQARQRAQKAAVSFGGAQMTYDELNRSSNQVAHLLQRAGVRRGHIVVILMDRCLETYVAMLGVLKAGAAYLPIDPNYPKERIRYILKNSCPYAVATKSRFLHQAEGDPDLFIVLFDELRQFQKAKKRSGKLFDLHDISACSQADPPAIGGPADLAYVIYTSGSTGTPKGVMIEHRSVVNLVDWLNKTFDITHQSHVMQNASIFFDASVQQIFPALTSGATLFPVPEDIRVNPPLFLEWMQENAISHWDSVPSLWYSVVDHVKFCADGIKIALPDLKFILLAGEPLRSDKVHIWLDSVEQNHAIFNIYGPTEATVDAACYPVGYGEAQSILPIGKPLQNLEIYILNKKLQLCMLNVEGEICIGGAGLARGYLNDRDLTDAAFVQVTLPGRERRRLYRTGDFGRLRSDGVLEFAGRRDEQVKIRGHRIDLSEIEAALRGYAGVDDAAVVVTKDGGENKKLIAYYTSSGADMIPDLARDYLKEHIPAFMIPHHFVKVEEFPVTTNNKIDKNALLHIPFDQDSLRSAAYQPPVTRTEKFLAGIWKEVLNIDKVGVNDDFFASGGDSILSIMIRHKCEQERISLKTIDIFRYPTIAALARYIDEHAQTLVTESVDRRASDRYDLSLAPEQQKLLPRNVEIVLPILPMQYGMLYEDALYSRTIAMPQIVHRCEGEIDTFAFEKAINVLVARHEALRTIFRTDITSQPLQVILSSANYKLACEDLSAVPTQEQEEYLARALKADRERGFDTSVWPLFRVSVYRKSATSFDIVWTMHHAISDGWSSSICYKELGKIYSGIVTRKYIPLPQPRSNFSDYVRYYLNRNFDDARRFWDTYLSRMTAVDIPKDFRPAEEVDWSIGNLDAVLDIEAADSVREFARSRSVTLNVVCLSAYYLFLKYICREDDLTIAFVTSGRSAELDGIMDIVGSVINTIPLRINLSNLDSFDDVVRLVQKVLLDVSAYDHLSLAEIARVASSGRNIPLLQFLFVFENYPSPEKLGLESFHGFRSTTITAFEESSFPLSVVGAEDEGRLIFRFEYATHLFREQTIRSWSKIFLTLLRQI